MNNERQAAQLEIYNHIYSQRRRSILSAEIAERATHSENLNIEPILEVANSNKIESNKQVAKKVLASLFATVR